ncbi:sec1 family domain-containing protein 2 [Lampris incognitus]|uniref:sec1 family domain-containing protein 2 n=1 Tax=Lampris incognitus TaxID=2546036 RepID=UPI0024B49FA6|nr:sec1 family domain-containing protein 2 [Lampris incognitus]
MMATDNYTKFPSQLWDKVLSKVKKAVVFMDDKCAECLHWNGGAATLFEAGACNLKQFSSFESCGKNEPKAVFVVSTLLKGRTIDIIKDTISLSHFQYCVVFTSVAHSAHLLANNVTTELEGNPVFEQFEEKLCEWMGNMNYTAEVMHAPIVFAPVSQQLLLMPTFPDLFPLLSPDLESINAKRPEKKKFGGLYDVDIHSLPPELQIEIKSLASALNAMFEATNTREESFAVGPMSRIIAGELTNHPQAKNRRKLAPNKASIIFVDRTMDLTGAVGHHGDNLVEKILTFLKPLPGHVTDVQVDMLELTSLQHNPNSHTTLAPGCLAQTQETSSDCSTVQNVVLISSRCVSPEEVTMERAHSAVEKVFETLRGLSQTRDHLKQLRSVYTASDGIHQATYRPFLRQVLEEVFNPDRVECPDIEHMSGGLTDLLKTGFSMFMKVSRPHPSDHPLLFLFLVGGVTPSELRMIKEVVSAHKQGTQVLVLSTRLLRPADIPELLFTTQRLVPDMGV